MNTSAPPTDTQCPDCGQAGEAPYDWPTGRYFRCRTTDCPCIAYFVWLEK